MFLTSSDPNQRTLSPPLSLIPVIFWTHWPYGLYSYEISTQPAYEFLSVNFLYISYGILSPWRELGWSEGGWYKTTKKVSEIFPMSFLQDTCSTDSAFFLTVTFILTKMNGLCDLLPLTPTSYRSDLSRTMSGIVYFSRVLVQSGTHQISSLKMSWDSNQSHGVEYSWNR